ncbi:serine/threonine-protein kinase [Nocardiopsis alba]|uniref:serine/threonine-protein kinase n=1 Tax=Nocardiopsis alba TaxID=53437 RepID=UPI000A037736
MPLWLRPPWSVRGSVHVPRLSCCLGMRHGFETLVSLFSGRSAMSLVCCSSRGGGPSGRMRPEFRKGLWSWIDAQVSGDSLGSQAVCSLDSHAAPEVLAGPPMHPLTPADPRVLGEIKLLKRLGKGGMGVVYLGLTPDGEHAAVKTMLGDYASQSEMRERFQREASALGMVHNPGTAALMGVSDPNADRPWLAMEYITGLDLDAYVKGSGALDEVLGTGLAYLLTEALDAVHTAGLLHRDLKPANIMLGPTGPKVVDFGLVAIGGAGGDLTMVGAHMGTPLCMAPEQFGAADQVDRPADVYALGAVLAFSLTGRYPYNGANGHVIYKDIHDPGVAPDLEGAPAPLLPLLSSLLSVNPEERPSLAQVRARLLERLSALGLTPGAARELVAEHTHVNGTEVPDTVLDTPRTRKQTRVAEPVLQETVPRRAAVVAERLRKAYARPEVAA